MNTYKGQFDVPDGMHIQGVYDTTIETSVSTNENEFYNNIAKKMTDITGESAFAMDRTSNSSVGADGTAKLGEGSGGRGSSDAQAGASGGQANRNGKGNGNVDFAGTGILSTCRDIVATNEEKI